MMGKGLKNAGVFLGAISAIIWGVVPLYWRMLNQVCATEILAHRIVWAALLMVLLLTFQNKTSCLIENLKNPKIVISVFASAFFICINWLVYIWAVNSNQVIEASMGYYINPLLSALFGIIFLKEKLGKRRQLAFLIAATGVAILIIFYGKVPWISLIIAGCFASYGLTKKLIPLEISVELTMEMLLASPFALVYILFRQLSGMGAIGKIGPEGIMFLIGSGVVTVVPLLLYSQSAKLVNLSVLGFLQYFSPTISLLLGFFVFQEDLPPVECVSLCLIWTAIVIFSWPARENKRLETR